jgi:hypothetical protein
MYLDASASRLSLDSSSAPAADLATAEPQIQSPAAHTSSPSLVYNAQASSLQAAAGSFDAQVRGTAPRAIDLDLAKMAQDAYNLHAASAPQGWSRLSQADLTAAGIDPASLDDPSTGFRAAIYQNALGHHVLAFAGTDPSSGKDWLADGTQALGLPAAQYDQAVALAQTAKLAFGDSLVITGHSLGGGLAATASAATNSAAVTFNAAGVNDATLRRALPDATIAAVKQQANGGLIRRYAVAGEILTYEQETGPVRAIAPDALGHKITLNDPAPLPWIARIPGVNLIADTVHGISLHSMGSVLDAMRNTMPWN